MLSFTTPNPKPVNRRKILIGSAAGLTGLGLAASAVIWLRSSPPPFSVNDPLLSGPLGDVWIGSAQAKLSLIEYAALTCLHCAAFHQETWPIIKKRWIDSGQVRFALRGFPLNAVDKAGFILARADGGRNYYAIIDLLFDKQAAWAFDESPLEAMREIMRQAGFDRKRFEAVLSNADFYDAVNLVQSRANEALGVHVTPTIFVNEDRYEGALSPEKLSGLISQALSPTQGKPPATNIEGC